MIVSWCNGSTAVFGSACLGSNPGETTIKSDLILNQIAFSILFTTLIQFNNKKKIKKAGMICTDFSLFR